MPTIGEMLAGAVPKPRQSPLAGVLPAVFSAGDKLKRMASDFAADPMGNIQQRLGFLNDQAGQFNQLHSQATQESVNSIKGGGSGFGPASQQLAGKLADAYNPMGMVVWHGSPHKFSKFDSSKIGTGEGAQAYGHGLYLAESPDVATTYSNLRAAPNMEFHTASGRKLTGLEKSIADDMLSNGMASARIGAKANGPEWEAAFNRIKDEYITRGSIYKVDLPDDAIAKMLDWDKPLSQQAPEVKSALSSIAKLSATGEQAWKAAIRESGNPFSSIVENRGMLFDTPESAAKNLRRLGIPGIRYLDGGSRGAGSGTSNFVVFPGNESLLQILERNGAPIK